MESIGYLKPEEILAVLAEAKKKSARDHCLILIGYRHGLRATELSLLQLDDVENGRINVKRLKGSDQTLQPLYTDSNPLLDERKALASWLAARGDGDGSVFLFTSRKGGGLRRRAIYAIFEDAATHAGIEPGRRNVHILKHSICVHLKNAGAPVDVVQRAVGHADPATTLRFYYHTTQDETAVAVKNLFGAIYA